MRSFASLVIGLIIGLAVLAATAKAQTAPRIPFSSPAKPAPARPTPPQAEAPISQPSPGGPAPVQAVAPAIDHVALAQAVANAVAQPVADAVAGSVGQVIGQQLSAQAASTNAAIATLTDAVTKLTDAAAKADERRSADVVAFKTLLTAQPSAPASPATAQSRTQTNCGTDCPGPDACSCPCNAALKNVQAQLAALQAKTRGMVQRNRMTTADLPKLYFRQTLARHWIYGVDPDEVDEQVAKENAEDAANGITNSVVRTTSYVVPAQQTATYSMPAMSYAAAPMMDMGGYGGGGCSTGSCGTSTDMMGSMGGGLMSGFGMGLFGSSGGSCAGGSCR